MVFWKTYPISNIIKKWNTGIFTDLRFEKEDVFTFESTILDTNKEVLEIKHFIKNNFGGNKKPVLDIPEDKICGKKDTIIYVRDTQIIGCIRYKYIGMFLDKEIYCVDCFCIHPSWRKKGLGDYLLTKLHIYVNKNNIPYSMFLKEGPQLNIMNTPIYSGVYVYRKVIRRDLDITALTIDQAYKLIDIFCEFNDIFIIKNKDNLNQYWKLYKREDKTILACIQDTYQYLDGKKIGWITGWIESPNITDDLREDALHQISNSMDFYYMWANRAWTNANTNANTKEWKIDGSFHWYLYQWTTSIRFTSYCVLS